MKVTIQDYQRGVLHTRGRPGVVLLPGVHRFRWSRSTFRSVDLRPLSIRIPAQEMLTADAVVLRIGVVVVYHVVDALAWTSAAGDADGPLEPPAAALRLAAQLATRESVAQRSAEDVLAQRAEISAHVLAAVSDAAATMGAEVDQAAVRDVLLPAHAREAFAQVATARQEARAALERARGEQAVLRSLANAARLVEATPGLAHLRTLAAAERPGASVVLDAAARTGTR